MSGIYKSKIESYTKRFFDIDGIKLLLFIKEVESENIPITKIENYRLDLIFPGENGGNVRFPNVVRYRDPFSINILKYTVGNVLLIENRLINTKVPMNTAYFNKRKEVIFKINVAKNIEIGEKIEVWSDSEILNRGKEFFDFISDRYQISIDQHSLKQILIDNITSVH